MLTPPEGSYPIGNQEDRDLAKEFLRNYPATLRTYEELLERAKEAMAKDKRNIILPKPVTVMSIPPNLTAENYQDMNIVPGHRVSWEYKQKYIHKLAELFAEGYLTENEYDKRVEWVNDAQTSEQIDVAFTDLQRPLMTMKVDKYLPERKTSKKELYIPLSFILVLIAGIVVTCVLAAQWWAVALFSTYFAVVSYRVYKILKRAQ